MADDEFCKIYDAHDAFTSIVQVLLAFIALASLYVKRQHEFPRRKFMTWWLDVSKQGFGAVYSHVANMVVAALVSGYSRGNYELQDQCAWYGINFLIDTSVGLYFSIIMLDFLTKHAHEKNWTSLQNRGVYEGADGMKHWTMQLIAWMVILTITKFILVFIIWALYPILARLGDLLFRPLQANVKFELIFVMILFPGVLNFFYFWIADQYLKADPSNTEAFDLIEIEHTLSDYVTMSSSPTTKAGSDRSIQMT
jgi:hypothetical protein